MLKHYISKLMIACTMLSTLQLSAFDLNSYNTFLGQNNNLSSQAIVSKAEASLPYYSEINDYSSRYLYLDSTATKYKLTGNELELLSKNNFVVTERKSFNSFEEVLIDIFRNDLPIFVTTDLILNTLHLSYVDILAQMEKSFLQPAIKDVIEKMRKAFATVQNRYLGTSSLKQNLQDVDLYLTIASSLIDSTKKIPVLASTEDFNTVWNAIAMEKYLKMPLFSTQPRKLDFSQFTLRGHYAREKLGPYFRTMMWLGRTEFLITAPKVGDIPLADKKDLQRMTIDAVLLSEILEESGAKSKLAVIDSVLSFIIGESDNCTPHELTSSMSTLRLNSARDILDINGYNTLSNALLATPEAGQKILSQVVRRTTECSSDSPKLPISFLLLGQRFIDDSYIFGNVVYANITHNGKKMKRMMPDPLDIAYAALGNNDAAPLLQNELSKWHYAPQLEKMRYLVDSYNNSFWTSSLYNVWLYALRTLSPSYYPELTKQPLFMRTAAWHQEKLNTQLASWAQLRHDNLLYSKQSYTDEGTCFYPHGYVEPYPDFYKTIGTFAQKASRVFGLYDAKVSSFYSKVSLIMDTLTMIAEKELAKQPFSVQDSTFFANLLIEGHSYNKDEVKGWIFGLFFEHHRANDDDFTIADVHTQPTDEAGNTIGKVLHVGVGKVNLGIFLAESPSSEFAPMAYAGPVSSYYQTITSDFKRLSDEEWERIVTGKSSTYPIPQRPDWINSYCADKNGVIRPKGRILRGVSLKTGETGIHLPDRKSSNLIFSFHPGTGAVNIKIQNQSSSVLSINIFNILGRCAAKKIFRSFNKGTHKLTIPLNPGTYIAVIKGNNNTQSRTIPLLILQ